MGTITGPHLELRQLRYFVAVAQEQSFTRAAARLHVAQPALSRQIRQLEDAMGTALFERTTRSVSLTAAGTAFFAEVKKVFAQLEQAVDACRQAAGGHSGHLRLGYTGRASQLLLPGLMREFHARYAGVVVDIDGPHDTGYLQQALLNRRLDVALCFLPVRGEGLHSRKLLSTELAIALPASHPLAREAALSLEQLRGEPFVAYPSGQGFHLHEAMRAACERAGFSPRVVRESDASQTLMFMIAAGTGVGIVPAETQALMTDGVVFKSLGRDATRVDHGLAWLDGNGNPALHNLLALANEGHPENVGNNRGNGHGSGLPPSPS